MKKQKTKKEKKKETVLIIQNILKTYSSYIFSVSTYITKKKKMKKQIQLQIKTKCLILL